MLSLYEANFGKNFTCHWQAISSVSIHLCNEYHFLLDLSQFESGAPEEEVKKLHKVLNINTFISVVGDVSVVLYVGKAWMGYHSP